MVRSEVPFVFSREVSIEGDGFTELAVLNVSSDHGVAEEGVLGVSMVVEDAAGISDSCKWVGGGCIRTCGNEFGEKGEIGLESMPEHESMDLEKGSSGDGALQERDALLLFWAP